MKTPDWFVFKDFLDASPLRNSLLSFVSQDIQEDLKNTPPLSLHPSHGISSYIDRLKDIHYSWLIPYIEKLDDPDKYLFISPLPEFAQQSLLKHFDLSREPPHITPSAQLFICMQLYQYLTKDYKIVLPKECLPEDPLNSLLSLSREDLLHLVDLLSLHDLSLEMKTIINASHLVKIEALLSKQQKTYLYRLKQTIEPIAFTPMGLHHWNGDETLLKKVLHQRGLNRLSKALSLSHYALLWHLAHKLDIGRASIVKSLFKELKNKRAHAILVEQVCDLLPNLSRS